MRTKVEWKMLDFACTGIQRRRGDLVPDNLRKSKCCSWNADIPGRMNGFENSCLDPALVGIFEFDISGA